MSSQRRNKKKSNKQPLKAALSPTEKGMIETLTRTIEKEMENPTKMKIFDKIKYVLLIQSIQSIQSHSHSPKLSNK